MLLGRLELILQRLITFAFTRPKIVLTLSLALTFALGAGSLKLTQVVSMVDQLDPEMLSTINTLKTRELFEAQPSLGFILRSNVGFTGHELCRVRRFMNRMERKFPQIASSFSGFDLRQLQTNGNVAYYPLVLADPCTTPDAFAIDKIQASPWAHLLTNPSLRDFTVSFGLKLDEPTSFGTFNPELVGALLQEIQTEFGKEVPLIGTLAQEYFTMQGLSDSQWLNLLILIIIFFCFRLFLGSFKAAPIYGLTLVMAAAMVYGLMGWMGHAVDPLSVCLFLILAISSMEDFVFISQSRMSTSDLPSIFSKLALPCFLTSLTTVLAFMTLGFSDLESIRRFGIWAAVGGLIEWGLTFMFLPALMTVFPGLSRWTESKRTWGDRWFLRALSLRVPRWVSVVSVVFFLFAGVSVNNFKMSQTPTEMFPKDHPFQQSLDFLLKDRGWVASIDMVMTREVTSEKRQQLHSLITTQDIVLKTESWQNVVSYVAAGKGELARAMVERELQMTDLSRRYRNAAGDERVVVYLKTSNTEKLNNLRRQVEVLCPANECWLSGEFVGFADFSQSLISTLFESLFFSVMIVASVLGTLAILKGQARLLLGLVFSSLWGPAVLLSLIYFYGISINFVTCVVASCLVGLTGDNAIMFLCHEGSDIQEGIQQRALGSVQTALMMALCSLTFVFSYFEPPQMLGILLSVGFIASLIGDVWLLKGFAKNSG